MPQDQYYVLAASSDIEPKLVAALYATPGIIGVHIGVPWCEMNPAEGVYDFSAFDAALALVPSEMQIGINLGAGFAVPPWLVATLRAAQLVVLDVPTEAGGRKIRLKFPVPWAQPVVDAYLAAFTALASHLDTSRVGNVRVLGTLQGGWNPILGQLGSAFTLPNDTTPACAALWAEAGFRPTALGTAWMTQVDAIAALFPTSALTLSPFEPPFAFPWVDDTGAVLSESNSEASLDAMIALAAAAYGTRLMLIDVSFSNLAQRAVFGTGQAAGASLGFQPNTWGRNGMCREGPQSNPGPGGRAAISTMLANAKQIANPGKPYIEFHTTNLKYLVA